MNSIRQSTALATAMSRMPGGYRRMDVNHLLAVWHAYRTEKRIRFVDFRVYLALHEMAERRRAGRRSKARRRKSTLPPKRNLSGIVLECARLLRVRDSRVASGAIQRLARAGLISISEHSIRLKGQGPASLEQDSRTGLAGRNVSRRTMAVPRRVLRHLAGGETVSRTATMLGHLLRCVFHHRGSGWNSVGSCSIRFVAELFGVDARSVKRARRRLVDEGWLKPESADHWHVQAQGARVKVNLSWFPGPQEPLLDVNAAGMSPRPPGFACPLSPPGSKRTLPLVLQNHTPAFPRGVGVWTDGPAEDPPRLADVRLCDLVEADRLQLLCQEACARGWIRSSEHDTLRVFSAAAHARRVGRTNPCGLFVVVLRRGLWMYLSNDDDDTGRALFRSLKDPRLVGPANRPRGAAHSRELGREPEEIRGVNNLAASLARAFTMPGSTARRTERGARPVFAVARLRRELASR